MISVTQIEQKVQQNFKQMNIHTKPTTNEFGDLKVVEKLTYHNLHRVPGMAPPYYSCTPNPTDPEYLQWKQQDSLVVTELKFLILIIFD